jgi:glycosylphosphatidylinositol transamidase
VWIFVFLGHEAVKAFKANPYFNIGTYKIPTWTSPLFLLVFISALVPNVSFLGHLCALSVGYICRWLFDIYTPHEQVLTCHLDGFGYLKILAPPEKILRWIEGKLNLLGRLPHYVSVDQKTYGRYGVLPTSAPSGGLSAGESFVGHGQRLGSP